MKIIIPIIVGAAIGYFTNWLAIKMLFRPLEEKRIVGIKVPFTPGLIPKERERIAKSIGEAVGMHLLTPEKITEVISSDETKLKLRSFINSKLEGLKKSEKTFKEALSSIGNKENHLISENIKEKIFKSIMSGLKDEELKINLIRFIEEDIYEKYKVSALDSILTQGDNMLEEMKGSERLKDLFIDLIDVKIKEINQEDRILKDIIPQKFIDKLNLSIEENKEAIVDRLRELFYKPSIQTSIKLSIEELVEQNVSKMITMFLEPAVISEKVFSAISKYVDSDQAEEVTSFILKDSIDNIASSKVSAVSEYISNIIGQEDRENLYQKFIDYFLSEENRKNLLFIIKENAELKDEKIKSSIIKKLEIGLDDILNSGNFKIMIKKLIDSNIDKIMGLSISQTFNKIDDKEVEILLDTFDNIFNTILKDELYNIIKLFNVSQIVEDEINSFEVEYTEKLILDIADRELKAITRLGALLGAIMGLLMPLLQMI
nr:DUF445 family protein [Tissierella sp.]